MCAVVVSKNFKIGAPNVQERKANRLCSLADPWLLAVKPVPREFSG